MEEWKEIPSHPKYMASNLGRIKNKKGKILKPYLMRRKYFVVSPCVKHQSKTVTIHSLIMQTFIGNRPDGLETNHKDGNKLNNNIENLEYITKAENCSHASKCGLEIKKLGKANPQTKLTEEQVKEIRRLKAEGVRLFELAKQFKVNDATINSIIKGETWSWLK